ncbi:MAG: ABC transporter permease [Chloroflexi bacterium]|nr:ABC transporter permease [Chloroflexota bacterium]
MDILWEGLKQGIWLIISGDPEVIKVTVLSLAVSGSAVILSLIIGIPLGTFLALSRFPGRRLALSAVNTGMGFPPVVIGLVVLMLLWRSGPLGFLDLLYTPAAMVIAQVIIASPVVTGLSLAAIQQQSPLLKLQTIALGATRWQMLLILWREARLPLLAALMAGFGAVISEVGAVIMVGGNIKDQTRVLTTAVVMESRMGHFDVAVALSAILLALTFAINYVLTHIQQRKS